MPNMANVTVKAANGTTDVVYTALTPASGDQPARWSDLASSTQASLRSVVELRSRDNASRDARVVSMVFKMPDVRTVSGVDTIVGSVPVEIRATIPRQVSDAVIAEAVARAGNFFVNTLTRSSFQTGYAPQ